MFNLCCSFHSLCMLNFLLSCSKIRTMEVMEVFKRTNGPKFLRRPALKKASFLLSPRLSTGLPGSLPEELPPNPMRGSGWKGLFRCENLAISKIPKGLRFSYGTFQDSQKWRGVRTAKIAKRFSCAWVDWKSRSTGTTKREISAGTSKPPTCVWRS